MSDSTDRALGRIEGKLDGLEEDIRELKTDVKKGREENERLRDAIARAAEKWDPETGMLRAQYVACPYHRAPTAEVEVTAQHEAQTGMLRQVGRFFAALAGLAGAAWAYVAGTE